jgi:hypothetical protein
MIPPRSNRRGYALMLVIVFVALFLTMLGLAWRQTSSLLRVETIRAIQSRRDRGCLLAAVRGIHYLEKCQAEAAVPEAAQAYYIDGFPNTFTVTFTLEAASGGSKTWSVTAKPTATP